MVFSLIFVLRKIWYFRQLRKITKIWYLRWAFLQKYCFSYSDASTEINHTKAIFSRNGIPREVVSDNGTQHTSYEYKKFSQEWHFKHTNSSRKCLKWNGFVERNIQTIKTALQKRTEDDLQMALLMLRTAPLWYGSPAPATKLMGRTVRTLVPKLYWE